MASKTRLSRRNAGMELDYVSLTNTERLMLAQAVYELGADAWNDVSELLSKHALITRPKNTFTPDACQDLYTQLMQEAGLESPEDISASRAPVHLKLAQRHYQARVLELRDLIAAEEVKFKTIVKEIDEIRSGLWDTKLDDQPQATPTQEVTEEVVSTVEEANQHSEDHPPSAAAEAAADPPPADAVMASPSPAPAELARTPQHDVPAQLAASPEANAPGENKMETSIPPETIRTPARLTRSPSVQRAAEHADETQGPEEEDEVGTKGYAEQAISPSSQGQATEEHTPSRSRPEAVTSQEPDMPLGHIPDAMSTKESTDGDVEMAKEEGLAKEEEETPGVPEDIDVEQVSQEVEIDADEEGVSAPEDGSEQAPTPSDTSFSRRRQGKRRASDTGTTDSQRERKRAREDSELADDDEQSVGSSRRRTARQVANVDPTALKRFQTVITMLYSQIAQHRNGAIFQNPIKTSEAPDYHDIVKRPMDLKTIKQKIKDGLIVNSLEFQRDIYLIFANAMMYNRPGSDIYRMAEQMMLDSEGHINTFKHTEGFVRGVHRV